jgi:hypothetical protein
MRTLRIVAMRKVRGREKDVSRTAPISPNYESLNDWRRSESVTLSGFIRTNSAVAIAQVREGFMILGSEQNVRDR